jgi:desulfoferrodoxin (superoxide reductase-like protein)
MMVSGSTQDGSIHAQISVQHDDWNHGHHLKAIYLRDENDTIFAGRICSNELKCTKGGVARAETFVEFRLPQGLKKITPYVACNVHGPWMGETLDVEQLFNRHSDL